MIHDSFFAKSVACYTQMSTRPAASVAKEQYKLNGSGAFADITVNLCLSILYYLIDDYLCSFAEGEVEIRCSLGLTPLQVYRSAFSVFFCTYTARCLVLGLVMNLSRYEYQLLCTDQE